PRPRAARSLIRPCGSSSLTTARPPARPTLWPRRRGKTDGRILDCRLQIVDCRFQFRSGSPVSSIFNLQSKIENRNSKHMKVLKLLLLPYMAAIILGAFLWPAPAEGFIGESSRIVFFHVP